VTYRVEATATASGWTLTMTGAAGGAPAVRQLQRTAGAGDAYPLPDRAEAARWAGQPHATYCDDAVGAAIGAALRRILRNESSAAESQAFGRYLLDTLLGPAWDAIDAATPAGQPIELELAIASEDVALLRLPWEMMHDAGGALAARKARKVAFTRLIPPVAVPVPAVAPQPVPLRILFVVGRQLDNSLRPGAEFLGLLRHLRVPANATFKTFTSAAVSVRYLGEATVDELESAIHDFQPSVVHFTCHGEVTAAGLQLLLTAREKEADPASRKTQDPYPIGAARLLSLLRGAGGALPPVVVVNACHTADSSDERMSALSFAARLVEGDADGGVAMAVGMTGEVDDRACQAFTLRFYQALVAGAPVAIAAAEGRRGAMLEYPELQDSLEWIRATLFRAEKAADVLPLQPATLALAPVAYAFRKQATWCDIVCDRYDTLALAQDFLTSAARPDGQRPLILPFASRHPAGGLGHTRLLEEIAGLAVYAGYLPCVLRSSETSEPAANLLELALSIADALKESIEVFRLVAPATPAAFVSVAYDSAYTMAGVKGKNDFLRDRELAAWLKQERANAEKTGGPFASYRELIASDCASALAVARTLVPQTTRVLILVDDLHRYAGLAGMLVDETRAQGLGTIDTPLPLVFTYRPGADEGKKIQDRLSARGAEIGLTARNELAPFETTIEQQLVYRQLLLAAHSCVPTALPGKRIDVDVLINALHDECQGRPKNFNTDVVKAYVRINRRQNPPTLVDARFEDLLAKWP